MQTVKFELDEAEYATKTFPDHSLIYIALENINFQKEN
jgi:hypothetical protein